MIKHFSKALLWTWIAVVGSGNAFAETVRKLETKAYDLMDKDITAIKFEKGNTQLSESEKASLKSVVEAVRGDSDIDKIIVASWSDESLPKNQKVDLSKTSRDLAEKRGEQVKTVLKDLGARDVEIYSMAKQPSWIGKTFGSEEAKVKESMEGKKVEDREPKTIAQVLEEKGGPSKAVIIVKRESSISH
ncbi:MAG: hypothetical protein AB7T49_03875 [Oligoflexales bacterium]